MGGDDKGQVMGIGGVYGVDRYAMRRMAGHFRMAAESLFTGCPFYQRICLAIAKDPGVLDVVRYCREGEPASFLLLGALKYLGGGLAESKCREGSEWASASAMDFEAEYQALREEWLDQRRDLIELLMYRRVQTNEVGRSCVFALGAAIGAEYCGVRRIHVVDLGSSAGLNLFWDRYNIGYGKASRPGDDLMRWGSFRVSGVRLTCLVDGQPVGRRVLGCFEQLEVIDRVGIDSDGIDLSSPEDFRWLRALIWCGQEGRLERFEKAVREAKGANFEGLRGDATKILVKGCGELSTGDAVLVMHSYLLDKLTSEQKWGLKQQLAELSRDRPVIEVGIEYGVQGSRWGVSVWSGLGRGVRIVAGRCHPHGESLHIESCRWRQ